MDENDQSEELQKKEEQQQGQRPQPIDRINDLVRKQRNARTWANRTRKMFGLGRSPATTVAQTVVKQVAASGARTALFAAGGSTFLLIILVILILLPPFATTGESAGLPVPGGGGDLPPQNTGPLSCPIPSGIVTCGSQAVPVSGCGHCGTGYASFMSNCNYPGIYHAMDVAAGAGAPIYLPTVASNPVRWTFLRQTQGRSQAIQIYAGLDTKTQEQYYIEFHHTQSGSGKPGAHDSGELGAQVCSNCNHVHIEFGGGNSSGVTWLEAPRYFCS